MNINKLYKKTIWTLICVVTLISTSCNNDLIDNSFDTDNVLELSVSTSETVLEELFFNNEISFNWSTGTNQGTGEAITYTLELDVTDGDFSNPIATFAKNIQNSFSYRVSYGDLNNFLLEYGLETGSSYNLQARITANVSNKPVEKQFHTTNFNVTTFKPVSSKLFIIGDGAPNGWDIVNATELEVSTTQRGVFIYKGDLGLGNFKFTINQNDCWCQDFYTKDANDDTKIVYNEGGSGNDLQWSIDQALGRDEDYLITVDLLNKTITKEIIEAVPSTPPFNALWIVGDASESGWNIDSPASFTQSDSNPFEFSYEGQLNAGNFKIAAGSTGDWCGQWYRPSTNNQTLENESVEQNSGCTVDNSWVVTSDTSGRYKITVDTQNNIISFSLVTLHIVGDGGPNGWDISNPNAMEYINGEYVFNGELGLNNPTGEFKISKFTGDWCDGDWLNAANASQSINNTSFITTKGCDGPDNKWKLEDGEAGVYEIRINLATEEMTIIKQ